MSGIGDSAPKQWRGQIIKRGWMGWLLLPLVMAAFWGALANPRKDGTQPIAYNHKLHLELGLECQGCHQYAETGSRASIPNIDVCGGCHDDAEVDNPEARKVADYVARNERIPWRQVHRVPDHVYFSHRRHVRLGELQCSMCHGDVAQMEKPFEQPHQAIRMDWCTSCHRRRGVDNDCFACHR